MIEEKIVSSTSEKGSSIGDRIKWARKNAGLTQQQLADKLGIKYQTIAQYEKNKRNPKLETVSKIARALNVDEYVLLGADRKFEFKDNLIKIRVKLGLSQQELAEKLFCNVDLIKAYEDGTKYPNFMDIETISGTLNVPLEELLGDYEVNLLLVGEDDFKRRMIYEYGYTFSNEEIKLIKEFSQIKGANSKEEAIKSIEWTRQLEDSDLKSELITAFDKLNIHGQAIAVDFVDGLSKKERYQK